MKTIIKMALLTIVITMCSGVVMAQEKSKERLSREELALVQAQTIAKKLSMNDEVSKRFENLYVQQQKEIWALGPRLKNQKSRQATPNSEEETKKEIEERFERSEKILEIRQKYYLEYSKFLSQNEIKRIYQLERKIMERLSKSRPTKSK